MSQYDFGTIDAQTKDGTQLAADLNQWRTAINSSHWGGTRPTYAIPGTMWVNDSASPDCKLYLFDGTADLLIYSFNSTSHTASLSVTKDSDVGAANIPSGLTGDRPAVGASGMFRFNESLVKFEGFNGTTWGSIGGGATGAAGDEVFVENSTIVTANYTLSLDRNAHSVGPITVNSGITVTIPSGYRWAVT